MRETGRATVTTAGTRERITDLSRFFPRVDISSLKRNTDDIYIGDRNVLAASGSETGHVLEPGDTITLTNIDLYHVWIDSNVNGEGVMWMAFDEP